MTINKTKTHILTVLKGCNGAFVAAYIKPTIGWDAWIKKNQTPMSPLPTFFTKADGLELGFSVLHSNEDEVEFIKRVVKAKGMALVTFIDPDGTVRPVGIEIDEKHPAIVANSRNKQGFGSLITSLLEKAVANGEIRVVPRSRIEDDFGV